MPDSSRKIYNRIISIAACTLNWIFKLVFIWKYKVFSFTFVEKYRDVVNVQTYILFINSILWRANTFTWSFWEKFYLRENIYNYSTRNVRSYKMFKIYCPIRQRKSPKPYPSFVQTFRNSLALTRRDSFAEKTYENIRAKIQERDVIPSLLRVLQCFMQSECETRAHRGTWTNLKETTRWRLLVVFPRGRCLVN